MYQSPFQDLSLYPEIGPIQVQWRVIRQEALAARDAMVYLQDQRASQAHLERVTSSLHAE